MVRCQIISKKRESPPPAWLFVLQRHHGIYVGRAARWNMAGDKGDSCEEQPNADERDGIGESDSV